MRVKLTYLVPSARNKVAKLSFPVAQGVERPVLAYTSSLLYRNTSTKLMR